MFKVQEPGNKKRVSFGPDERDAQNFGPKTSSPVETRPKGQPSPSIMKGIKVPTLSEVVGSKKLSPKKFAGGNFLLSLSKSSQLQPPQKFLILDLDDELESHKTLITSIEALDHDKEHDRRRARYLLSGIEPYEPPKPAETLPPPTTTLSVIQSLPISTSALATVLCAPTLAAMTSTSSSVPATVPPPKTSTAEEVVPTTGWFPISFFTRVSNYLGYPNGHSAIRQKLGNSYFFLAQAPSPF
jgi:hypothetical protein